MNKNSNNSNNTYNHLIKDNELKTASSLLPPQSFERNASMNHPMNTHHTYTSNKDNSNNINSHTNTTNTTVAHNINNKNTENNTGKITSHSSSKHNESDTYLLTQLLHYREKLYPYLFSLFNQNRSMNSSYALDSFFNTFSVVVPFFSFSNYDLFVTIQRVLYQFKSVAKNDRLIVLTWSEDVILWLMGQYITHMTHYDHSSTSIHNNDDVGDDDQKDGYIGVYRLIEMHVLTRLAVVDHLIQNGDHVHLNVELSSNTYNSHNQSHSFITVQILNRRMDHELKRKISTLQSKL